MTDRIYVIDTKPTKDGNWAAEVSRHLTGQNNNPIGPGATVDIIIKSNRNAAIRSAKQAAKRDYKLRSFMNTVDRHTVYDPSTDEDSFLKRLFKLR